MAKLETEHVFTGTLQEVFEGIRQYKQYPQYIPAVSHIEILPPQEPKSVATAHYEVTLIKNFHYDLAMFEKPHQKIWWHLIDSNLMKANEGSWELEAAGKGKVKAVYSLDIKFKGLVPSLVTDQVAKANLPALFEGMQRLIDDTRKKN